MSDTTLARPAGNRPRPEAARLPMHCCCNAEALLLHCLCTAADPPEQTARRATA